MAVSNIGVVAVTPTTAVTAKPAPEPVESPPPAQQANEPEPPRAAPASGTGILVDRLA